MQTARQQVPTKEIAHKPRKAAKIGWWKTVAFLPFLRPWCQSTPVTTVYSKTPRRFNCINISLWVDFKVPLLRCHFSGHKTLLVMATVR